jgi:parallel beta-helix repeat protein
LRSGGARVRAARFRRSRRIAATATTVAAAAAGLVGLANQQASHAAVNGPTAPYEVESIVDTNYPIPTGALYVASDGTGSDTNPGTLTAPFATIPKALSVAPVGGTIVVRGGIYRESLGAIKKQVTIQAYPHEQPWVKGSVVVTAFTPTSTGFATPFTASMCDNCYPAAAIGSGNPAAGLPEQVFVDGAPLQQVTSPSAMGPGTFYVDRSAGQLYLHDDPTGHNVEVTVLGSAFTISSNAPGTIIRGLGFEHYAAVYQTTKGSASPSVFGMSSASGVTFDSDTFAWSASRALGIYGANNVVTNSKFVDNGMNGLTGNRIGGLDFENNEVAFSNFEHWDITPSPFAQIGGVKLTGVANTVMRGNDFHDNYSNGLWFDCQSHDQTIVNNTVVHNAGHGIAVEVSANSIVAGNTIAENGRDGLKISGANNVEVWNNTSVDNGWAQLGVYEDPRHDPNNIASEDTTNVRIANNVFEAGPNSTRYVFFNLDISNPKHLTFTQMVSADDHNDWGRTTSTNPKFAFSVQGTLTKGARYLGVSDLAAGTGREQASTSTDNLALQSIFTDPDNGDYTLLPSVIPQLAAPATLPTAVAAAMGTSTTPSQIGAT